MFLPKHKGGLGVVCLRLLNRALLSKWIWRFKLETNSIWVRCIKAWHKTKGFDGKPIARASLKGMWLGIANVNKDLGE